MTTSVTASASGLPGARTCAQKKRWVPDHDDGSTFTPGHWADDGEPFDIPPGTAATFTLEGEGESVAIWTEKSPAEDEPEVDSGATAPAAA